jgi:hypothetical protein
MNYEGTMQFNGIIQGVMSSPDEKTQLSEWIDSAAQLGIKFSPDFTQLHYNLMPASEMVQVDKVGDPPEEVVGQVLEQLWTVMEPGETFNLTSTLRSIRFAEGEEIQTVYVFSLDGTISLEQQVLEATTDPQPQPLGRAALIWRFGIAVVLAVVVYLLFQNPEIRDSLRGFSGGNIQPVSLKIKIESDFDEYFSVDKISRVRQRHTGEVIEFTLKRTEKYPESDEKIDELYKNPDNSLKTKLILESLQSGSVKYEFYDEEETVLGSGTFSVLKLMEEESTVVRIKPKVKVSIIHGLRLSPS